jgi:hypothetical protein
MIAPFRRVGDALFLAIDGIGWRMLGPTARAQRIKVVTDPQVIPFKRPWSTPTVVEVTCPARQAA